MTCRERLDSATSITSASISFYLIWYECTDPTLHIDVHGRVSATSVTM